MYFKINNEDFSNIVSSLKVGYETLVSDNSGRNAAGDTIIDVINKKIKLYVTFRHTKGEEMESLLEALEPYQVSVSFLEPSTGALKTISAYTGTPEPEYYTIQPTHTIFKPMNLNFIEL